MTTKTLTISLIEKMLRDDDWSVRTAAMTVCQKNGIEIPVIRTIEPPKKVYKKCLCNVIVVAEIPSDAQVRGSFGGKCRANKAKIVEIEDFDYSNEECSTGFHFFCTYDEAVRYN